MKGSKSILLTLNTGVRASKWSHRQLNFGFSRRCLKLIPHLIRVVAHRLKGLQKGSHPSWTVLVT